MAKPGLSGILNHMLWFIGGVGLLICSIFACVVIKGAEDTGEKYRNFAFTKFGFFCGCAVYVCISAFKGESPTKRVTFGITATKTDQFNRRLFEVSIALLVISLSIFNDASMESYVTICQYNGNTNFVLFKEKDDYYKGVYVLQFILLAVSVFYMVGSFFLISLV